MRIFSSLLCILVILSLMPGLGWTRPSGDASAEEPQQALQLGWKLTALYDRTNPNDNFNLDNSIQIYTGATVRRDGNPPGDFVCDAFGNWQVCGYTDGDASLWNLRWDQDHAGASGGPGWLWYDSHAGYDIAAPTGQPVAAAGNGTAYHTARYQPNGVRVDHPGVIYDTYYGHNTWRIADSTPVHYGTHIADSGQAGGGPHLHFGVKDSALNPVDPGWEGGALWAGGEPFPLGYVDQNNTPHGP
ncbi:MAG: M23 family metallopeptidase, partial [Anaerolineae bacterium]